MVAERSITAKLKLDKDQFSRELALAAAEAKAFEKAMSGSGGGRGSVFSSLGNDADDFTTSVNKSTTATKSFNKSLGDTDRQSRSFGKGIAASNSHMSLLVQYGIALGPALVPALTAAVPLAAALGSGLAVAAVGAGTAVLAFQGVGDALKAMNDYAIDPTAAHLQALNKAMDTLGPAGQDFVVVLNNLRPAVQNLQNIAQEGLFPGIQEGITSVMTQMPLIQDVIESVSTAMGRLAAEGGKALTSPFWTDFFNYIKNDATSIITNFSVGFGKLFEGVSALVLDFGPLTDTVAKAFANMGRAFSSWAQNLPNTQGFQDFISYLRDTGPQVLDTIGHLGKALLDIGVALSGLPAQESLLILNTLATVLSAIATSPIGPGLLAVAVGMAAITRAIGLWDTVQASALMQFFSKGGFTGMAATAPGILSKFSFSLGGVTAATALLAEAQTAATAANAKYLGTLQATSVAMRAEQVGLLPVGSVNTSRTAAAAAEAAAANKQLADAEKLVATETAARDATMLRSVGNMAKMGAGVAGLALAFTDLGDNMEHSNALTFALLGAFVPGGVTITAAAVGVGLLAGTIMDAKHADDEFNKALDGTIQKTEQAFSDPTDIAGQDEALRGLLGTVKEIEAIQSAAPARTSSGRFAVAVTDDDTQKLGAYNEALDKARTAYASLTDEQQAMRQGLNVLFNTMDPRPFRDITGNVTKLTAVAHSAQPALDQMGISWDTFQDAARTGGPTWDHIVNGVERYIHSSDTVAGRTKAVSDAIAGLTDPMLTAADSAATLKEKLDALFAPDLNLSQSVDDWRTGILELNKDLKGGSLDPGTLIGLGNRDVIRERVGRMLKILGDAADAGEGPASFQARFEQMTGQLNAAGRAAGINGPKLRSFLKGLHIDQGTIDRIFDHKGIDKATQAARDLRDAYEKIPKGVRTKVEADGVQADATVKSLMNKYDGLSRKDARTIIRATDSASPVLNKIIEKLTGVKDKNVTVSVHDAASGALAGIRIGLDSLHDKTINVFTNHIRQEGPSADGNLFEFANGGMQSIGNQHPQIATNRGPSGIQWAETGAGPWEAFISGAPNKRDRSLAIWEETGRRLQAFADGGLPGRRIGTGEIGRRSTRLDVTFIDRLTVALGKMRKEARDVERSEAALHRVRERMRNTNHRTRDLEQRLEQLRKKENYSKAEEHRLNEQLRHQHYIQKQQTKDQTQAEKELSKQRDELSKATEKWKNVQEKLLQQAQAASGAVLEQGAIFGGQGTSISVGGILAKLRQSGKDAQEFNHFINKLRGMGVNERVIQQLLEQGPTPEGLAAARNLAHASKNQIRQINRAESRLVGAATAVGATSVSNSHNTTINVKIEKVETTDRKKLDRELTRYTRNAVRIARSKA